jgi:hypothetical protein
MVARAVKTKLTQEDRIVLTNWIRERGGALYATRPATDKGTSAAMAKALDQAFQEFVAGKGPSI